LADEADGPHRHGAASSEAMPTSLLTAPRSSGVDTSSVLLNALPTLREGLRRFLFEVPEGVETSLVTLAPQPRWIVRPTAERRDFWRGIDLVVPDRGSAKFLEGLAEAADRIDKEKVDAFSTIMVITTNSPDGSGGDWQRMLDRLRSQIARHPVTVHVIVLSISEQTSTETPSGSPVAGATSGTATSAPAVGGSVATRATLGLKSTGSVQTQVGLALTKETGGRYEGVAIANSLLTLLPEFARRIARSYALQTSQYRVRCEAAPSPSSQLSVFTSYPGAAACLFPETAVFRSGFGSRLRVPYRSKMHIIPAVIRVTRVGATGMALVGALTAVTPTSARRAQEPTLASVLEHAGAYVALYPRQLSAIVAEESYVQLEVPRFGKSRRRALKSDVLLVHPEGTDRYVAFRDVFQVDGRSVRNRQERLTSLFVAGSRSADAQLDRIRMRAPGSTSATSNGQ